MVLLLVLWVVFAVLVGIYAVNKGRNGILLFFVSLVLSPIIGFIIAAASSPKLENVEGLKKCPACAEHVKEEAQICRFCGHKFSEESAPAEKNSRLFGDL